LDQGGGGNPAAFSLGDPKSRYLSKGLPVRLQAQKPLIKQLKATLTLI
jgi:hypothetical protein